MKSQEQTRSYCFGALIAPLLTIVLLNLLLYGPSLGGYFLADDFVHIDYLSGLSEGGIPKLVAGLAKNFYSNWMQAEGTTFYRPLISLTLAFDYLVGKSNPFFFHLTNLFYHISCAILLALIAGRLVTGFFKDCKVDTTVPSLVLVSSTGILFSLYPLHCEVINWVIARVDSVALAFNLLSLYLFLIKVQSGSKSRILTLSCLLSFVLSLMSKEMSVVLPAVATTYLFLAPADAEVAAPGLLARLRKAFSGCSFYWLTLIGYLGFRTAALGTVSGGYQGSIGESLSASLVKRWTDGSLWRVLYPLNEDIFGANHRLYKTLKSLYQIALVNLVLTACFCRGKWQGVSRLMIFALVWFVLDLAPTYQVWNLTENLQGGRFAYFATAPLNLMIAAILTLPFLLWQKSSLETTGKRTVLVASTALLTAVGMCFGQISLTNNQAWIAAQNEIRDFREAVEAACSKSGKLAVLNIPQSYKGAHMLYNAATMSVMLKPPLTARDLREQVITFEPATFGDAGLILSMRLKDLLRKSPVNFFEWDRQNYKLDSVSLDLPAVAKDRQIKGAETVTIKPDQALISPPLSINPLSYDCLTVQVEGAKSMRLTANDDQRRRFNAFIEPGQKVAVFNLSERKDWDSLGHVSELKLESDQGATIGAIELKDLSQEIPTLVADGQDLKLDNDGVARIKGPRASFNFDVSNIDGAASALFELSRPNSWFEHYSGTFRDKEPSKEAGLSGTLSQVKGKHIPLTFTGVKGHGFFELRIIALDKTGKAIGIFSEPLCFQL